jgi:hypothetical protein
VTKTCVILYENFSLSFHFSYKKNKKVQSIFKDPRQKDKVSSSQNDAKCMSELPVLDSRGRLLVSDRRIRLCSVSS